MSKMKARSFNRKIWKSINRLIGSCLVGAMALTAQAGSVYDDAFWWFNQPRETSGGTAGVVETGELADALRYGNPSHKAHQSTAKGYAECRSNVVETVKNAYFEKQLSVARFTDIKKDSKYYPGAFIMDTAISATRGTITNEFSTVIRFKWDGVNHSTAWLAYLKDPRIGVINGMMRIFPNPSAGGSNSGIPTMNGIVKDRWYDLGVSFCSTNKHMAMILMDDTGAVKTFEDNAYNSFPTANDYFRMAMESPLSSAATSATKYFTGSIQQMAMWNRALSDEEFMEAFKVAVHDKEMIGVANGSCAEFGAATGDATLNLDTANWSDYPQTNEVGNTWTLKFNLGDEYNRYGRNLVIKPVSGTATFSAKLNGADTAVAVASSSAGSEAALFFAADKFVSGENTIVLTRTDSGAEVALDAMRVEEKIYSYPTGGTVEDNLVIPEGSRAVIDVGSGELIYKGTITGGGELIKVGAGTLYLRNNANTYSGGTHLQEGIIQTYWGTTKVNSAGTGTITVESGAQFRVGCPLDNDFIINGSYDPEVPALYFFKNSLTNLVYTMNGNFVFNGTNIFRTAWEDLPGHADTEHIVFNGTMTGQKLAMAPHCRVRFAGAVGLAELEGYYDNGNLGAFVLGNTVMAVTNLVIDQTRVIVSKGSSNFKNMTLTFTGEHKVDGLGYFDLNGSDVTVKSISVVDCPSVDEPGCQILNSGSVLKKLIIDKQSGNVGAKLDGKLSLVVESTGNSVTFKARHHTMSGKITSARPITFSGGSISNVVSIGGNNGASFSLSGMVEGSLAGVTSIGGSSSLSFYVRENQFTPWQTAFTLTGMHGSTYKNSTTLNIVGGGTIRAKSLSYYNWPDLWEKSGGTSTTNCEAYRVSAPAGTYDCTDDDGGPNGSGCVKGGTIKVLSPVGEGTPITFVGTDGDLTAAANWRDKDGNPLTAAPDLEVPAYAVTFQNGAAVNVGSDIRLANLTLKGGATLNGAGKVTVYGKINVDDALDAGTSYAINTPLEIIKDTVISIPTNGTFAINGGVSGAVSLTLNGSQVASCRHQCPYSSEVNIGLDPDGGEFILGGITTLTGDIYASNAIVRVRGQLGAAEGDNSTLKIYGSAGDANFLTNYLCNVRFEGAKIYKKVDISGHGYAQPNAVCTVVMTPNATNEFYKLYTHGVAHDVQFRSGSVTWFRGKIYCYYNVNFVAPDADDSATEIHVACLLEIAQDSSNERFWNLAGGAHYFWEPGISGTVGGLRLDGGESTIVECNVDYPFTLTRYCINGYFAAKLRLNGTKFATPYIDNSHTSGNVEGVGEGAQFIVTNAVMSTKLNSSFRSKVTGSADLVMAGTNTLALVNSQSTSTGALCAASGVISMDAASTWAGDWKITGGQLALTGTKAVAEGQKLYVNGVEQAEGLYGAVGSGAPNEVSWITSGYLRLGKVGTMLIIK